MLLANDLLILKLEQFSFFLEVSHNLSKTHLEQVDFGLHQLYFLVLLKLLLSVLLHRHALLLQLIHSLLVIELELRVFVVQIGQFFVLDVCLLIEPQVLLHDVLLDLRDVLLGLRNGVFAEVI